MPAAADPLPNKATGLRGAAALLLGDRRGYSRRSLWLAAGFSRYAFTALSIVVLTSSGGNAGLRVALLVLSLVVLSLDIPAFARRRLRRRG